VIAITSSADFKSRGRTVGPKRAERFVDALLVALKLPPELLNVLLDGVGSLLFLGLGWFFVG
jgi:hypothetical protein